MLVSPVALLREPVIVSGRLWGLAHKLAGVRAGNGRHVS